MVFFVSWNTMSQSRQLAAIMFTDIAGYTALMEQDEDKAFQLLGKNRNIQRPIIENYGGKLIKEMGDGILASFPTISSSVYCALKIQKMCSSEPELKLRIGIHQGEVVFDGNDVFGSGVNIASRLERLAPIGGIVVSESIHKNMLNKKGISSFFIGEKQLRGVKESVKVYQVKSTDDGLSIVEKDSYARTNTTNLKGTSGITLIVVVGIILLLLVSYVGYTTIFKQAGLEQSVVDISNKSIAVLPFADLSASKDQEYFSAGLTEEIINTLTEIPDLKVPSGTSSSLLSNSGLPIKLIADSLGVSTILEGSVIKFENRLKVTAQLTNAADGFLIWSHTYERELGDIFMIFEELSRSIASALQMNISTTSDSLVVQPTKNIKAYNLYLQGRYLYNRSRDRTGLMRSIDYFRRAVMEDSLFANAHVGLAYCYSNLVQWGHMDSAEGLPKASSAALKALEIDSSLEMAYIALGYLSSNQFRSDEARQYIEQAIKLNPKNPYARLSRAWFFIHYDRDHVKGSGELEATLEIDPLFLLAVFSKAKLYSIQGEYEKAIEEAKALLSIDDNFHPPHMLLYRIYYLLGDMLSSFDHFVEWRKIYNENPEVLHNAFAESGWNGVYQIMIPKLLEESKKKYIWPLTLAEYCMVGREYDEALKYLEAGFDTGNLNGPFLAIDLTWKPLYDDDRFQTLIRKMGLPPIPESQYALEK